MREIKTDIFIVGGGAAGMAAALSAAKAGKEVLLCEKSPRLGGILNRCIHHGFGLGVCHEDLTGQEFAERMRRRIHDAGICVLTGTTVLSLSRDREALLSSGGKEGGLIKVHLEECILASGSYERTLESIPMAGTRPFGVFSAGCAQGLINEDGYDIGDNIVILGSGNVGQIMGRQLIQSGKHVIAMLEKSDKPGGIARNQRECIEAYHIPLQLGTTIKRIHGTGRIKGVTSVRLATGEETFIPCDTLITALGLIPERFLLKGLADIDIKKDESAPAGESPLPDWIRLCGNCDHIHDFVDTVVLQGEQLF